MKQYILNVLIALDMFLNVVFRGHEGETISSRTGRAYAEGKLWAKPLHAFLNWCQPNHCERAMQHDAQRADTVEFLETGKQ